MERVLAVLVSFDAPAGIAGRIAAVLEQVQSLVVVDNGSCMSKCAELEAALRAQPRLHLIRNRRNAGLARALNQGLAWAQAQGADWTLLLDHDSEPEPGMVAELLRAARGWPQPERVAAVAPQVVDARVDVPWRWHRSPHPRLPWFGFVQARGLEAPVAIDYAIGSGLLVRSAADRIIGGMWDVLFVDGVDTEYCLRARRCGYDVLAAPAARLRHSLGRIEARRILGMETFPTHHAPLRQYYIARNRLLLLRRYRLRFPSWVAFEACSALKLAAEVLLFEPDKADKLGMTLRGCWDGLLGRRGRLRLK